MLRLLAAGHDLREAAREAHVAPERVLRMYADTSFRDAVNALLDDRISV